MNACQPHNANHLNSCLRAKPLGVKSLLIGPVSTTTQRGGQHLLPTSSMITLPLAQHFPLKYLHWIGNANLNDQSTSKLQLALRFIKSKLVVRHLCHLSLDLDLSCAECTDPA